MLRTNTEKKTPETINREDLLQLVKSHLAVDEQGICLASIMAMSARKVALLREKIERLETMQMLDAEVLAMVVERVSYKPAKVEQSQAEIINDGKNHHVKLAQGPSFFACLKKTRNKYRNGGFGYICQATADSESRDVIWGVKIMHGGDDQDFKTSQHEARYNRMMGRECFMFQFGRSPGLLISWQEGAPLNELEDKDKLARYPFKQRLQWLVSLLEDINKMHQHYFVHFDLQAKNVVVNLESNKMSLIDYGISHRENMLDEFFTVGEDMRDLAEHIIRILFDSDWARVGDINSKAIYDLYEAAKNFEVDLRCTSEQALHYCQQLLDNLDGLTGKKLAAIQATTIHRKDLTVEDVLRGRRLA